MPDFIVLSADEIERLSNQDKIQYYGQLKEYYISLPFDVEKMQRQEKRYVRTINTFSSLVNALCRPTVINKELIPDGNGFIFVANHLGSFDQFPIIAGAIGNRPLHSMMKNTLFTAKELFRGYLFDFLGAAVPVDVSTPEGRARAQDTMIQLILHGSNVMYFPEGTRGTLKKYHDIPLPLEFKKGAVVNAIITGATIIPISINNDYRLFRKNHIVVRVNEPLTVNPADNVENIVDELRNRIIKGIKQNQEDGFTIKRKNTKNKWIYYKI